MRNFLRSLALMYGVVFLVIADGTMRSVAGIVGAVLLCIYANTANE